MNNKGFTLVELLATILVLALVMSIGTFSVLAILKNAKEKNYNLLLNNIKDASELYYQECKYANSNNSGITCNLTKTKLGDLVKYGYLKGNSTVKVSNNIKEKDKYTLVNPINDQNIENCYISVEYISNKIVVTAAANSNSNCPTSNEYNTGKMDANRQ